MVVDMKVYCGLMLYFHWMSMPAVEIFHMI